MAPVWGQRDRSLARAEIFIRHAAQSGADIICFPEQFATGWDPSSVTGSEGVDGTIVSSLQQSARDTGIAVLGSFKERFIPSPRNTAVAIGKDGQVLTTYAKIHLFSPAGEHTTFSPGSVLGLFSLGPFRCGIAICYDLRFPELFRAYTRCGVHILFVPSAWPEARLRHWELFISARAAENQVYVVGINTTGKTPVDTYSGNSMTADPYGMIISRATSAEQLLFTDIDMAVIDNARTALPVLHDRRDGLYNTLTDM